MTAIRGNQVSQMLQVIAGGEELAARAPAHSQLYGSDSNDQFERSKERVLFVFFFFFLLLCL